MILSYDPMESGTTGKTQIYHQAKGPGSPTAMMGLAEFHIQPLTQSGITFQYNPLPVMEPWASYLACLSLSFLICKMGTFFPRIMKRNKLLEDFIEPSECSIDGSYYCNNEA